MESICVLAIPGTTLLAQPIQESNGIMLHLFINKEYTVFKKLTARNSKGRILFNYENFYSLIFSTAQYWHYGEIMASVYELKVQLIKLAHEQRIVLKN